jgi:outer membrane protein TolC
VILSDAVAAYQRADDVTHHRYDGGIANGIDVGRADAQLADAQAQLAQVRAQRAVLAHAVATLAGIPAGEAQFAPVNGSLGVLSVPATLPATLLQRRPDIAAAERRMYAANRAIGVARAARFPQISLGGNGGFQSMAVSSLISAPNAFWAVGPQFSLPIFDGADQGADRSRKGRLGRGQRQLSRQRITGHARG